MHLLKYFKLANRENFSVTLNVRNTLRPKDSKGKQLKEGLKEQGWRVTAVPDFQGFLHHQEQLITAPRCTSTSCSPALPQGLGPRFPEPQLLPLSSHPRGVSASEATTLIAQ